MMLAYLLRAPQRKFQRLRKVDGETRVILIKYDLMRYQLILLYPLLMLAAVLVRGVLEILKPFVHIRFGRLWSWTIGAYSTATEAYLCEKAAGIQPKHTLDIFYHYFRQSYAIKPPHKPKAICNEQLDAMITRSSLRVWEPARMVDSLIRMLPGGSKDFTVKMPTTSPAYPLLDRFPPQLSFTMQEEERGFAELDALGVEPGAKFVCFHARDDAYLEQALPRVTSVYGDWTDDMGRDASIGNYLAAAEQLADLGYYAIRVGKFVKDPLNSDNPRIIDYAFEHHSDFMDVFLSAQCTFFIGQNSGMVGLPTIFRRPMAFVNIMPLGHALAVVTQQSLYIPKKYYSAEKGRLLTFCEIVSDRRLSDYPGKTVPNSREYYEQIGLEILENTPEEIAGLVLEMEQTLRGAFQPSREDWELQSRFLTLVSSFGEQYPNPEYNHDPRMGAHFLRAHPELLE